MEKTAAADPEAGRIGPWRAAFIGLCANLIGVGLARFGYTPLIPALIGARWFSPAAADYLGAANLLGYLLGAVLAARLGEAVGVSPLLRAMMSGATASFFACAAPLPFLWFFFWRFGAGFAGGVLIALAAPAVLPQVPSLRRGLAGGAMFTGVGLGVVASGTLVPFLLASGLAATWLGLGALSLALTIAAWEGWPGRPLAATRARSGAEKGVRALYLEYGLAAAGLVPHMIFLVDFIARGQGQGLASGARYWVLFGFGAMSGPPLCGRVADRIGFGRMLRVAFLLAALTVALPALDAGPAALIVSSFIVGALVTSVAPLALGRIHELIPEGALRQRAAWGWCTTAFALGQAAAAYAFSFLFAESGGVYALLFALGAALIFCALAIDLGAAARAL
jgi:predicted MFS family arabinose efflux permease